jgi:choline kinase
VSDEFAVVIPAAGIGRRMRSYGPKCLVQLADGRTVLRRQIDLVRQLCPRVDIVVVVGFEAERVIRTLPAGVRVVENEHYEETGVARSIAMGLRATTADRVLVVYGDLVFNWATLRGIGGTKSVVVVDRCGKMGTAEVGVTVVGQAATHFDYGLKTKWTGIVLLTGRELALFKQLAATVDRRRAAGHELLNCIIDRGGEFQTVLVDTAELVEIDSGADIKRAREVPL